MLKTFRLALLGACCLTLAAQCWAVEPQKTRRETKQPKKSAAPASMTGCIDQQNGQYVLIDDRTTDVIAKLEAVGFPQEGFARHLGHKVTVKGTSTVKEGNSVFQVRNVETVSDTCAPRQP